MPDRIAKRVVQDVEPVSADALVGVAVRRLVDANVPGLPAVEADGSYAGVFGAHELFTAFFPRYLEELSQTAMISPAVDEALGRRERCAEERVRAYLNTDHVLVEDDYSDIQLAELFLHHRVQVIPISTSGRIRSVVALGDFFAALADHVLSLSAARGGGSS